MQKVCLTLSLLGIFILFQIVVTLLVRLSWFIVALKVFIHKTECQHWQLCTLSTRHNVSWVAIYLFSRKKGWFFESILKRQFYYQNVGSNISCCHANVRTNGGTLSRYIPWLEWILVVLQVSNSYVVICCLHYSAQPSREDEQSDLVVNYGLIALQ